MKIKSEVCLDHIYVIRKTAKDCNIKFYVYLKGKSNTKMYEQFREFWCKDHYVDTAGKNAEQNRRVYTQSTKRG